MFCYIRHSKKGIAQAVIEVKVYSVVWQGS